MQRRGSRQSPERRGLARVPPLLLRSAREMRPAILARLALRRLRASWRLHLTVAVGAVCAAALMASVIVYTDAVRDIGLDFALAQYSPADLDVTVSSSSQRFAPQEYEHRVSETERQLRGAAGDVTDEIARFGRTATFFLTEPGGTVPEREDRPRAHFVFFEGLEERVRLVEGRSPEPAAAGSGPPTIEVWLAAEAAEELGVRVGDSFDLHPFWALEREPVRVEVVGIFEPIDPADRFWGGGEERLVVRSTSWPTYPFVAPERSLTGALTAYLPSMDGVFGTRAIVDPSRVTSRNALDVKRRLEGLEFSLESAIPRTQVRSLLPEAIELYRTKLYFSRLPLLALVIQVVGIVAYYLVLVSAMVTERGAAEIALLKSRGATTAQVLALAAAEAGMIGGAAVLVGPPLAAASVSLLGFAPAFRGLSGGGLLEVRLAPEAWALAAGGVLVALVAMLIPVWRAGRRTLVQQRQAASRPPSRPAFLRFYLDVVLAVVAAVAFYQLRERGSLAVEGAFGELITDPLLLMTPTLFMLMVALVFLRLFPVALRVLTYAVRWSRGAGLPLAAWDLVRRPANHARLVLLLLLATSIGMFTAGFRATLERSYDDRAGYEAAAALRITNVTEPRFVDPETFGTRLATVLGIDAQEGMPAARLNASFPVSRFRSQTATLLAVEPERFGDVAYWRDDFASEPLPGLLQHLSDARAPAVDGVPLPRDAACVGFWSRPPEGMTRLRVGVRVRDARRNAWNLPAVPVREGPAGWLLFVAPLGVGCGLPPSFDAPPAGEQLWLDAVYLRPTGVSTTKQTRTWYLDDLLAAPVPPGEDGTWPEARPVERFTDLSRWEPIGGISPLLDPSSVASAVTDERPDRQAVVVTFTVGPGGSPVVGLRPRAELSLPVLASREFLEAAGVRPGEEVTLYVNQQLVPARVVGEFRYFPPYRPGEDAPLIVTDLESLRRVADRVPALAAVPSPNEYWAKRGSISLEELEARGGRAESVYVRAELRAQAASDPLVAAGWEGILFLSFLAVLLLTGLGVVVAAYLSAEARSLEFGVLRTMGFSRGQVFAFVGLEHLAVIVMGVGVGTLLGMPLGRLMVEYVSFTETGEAVVPPLVARVSWETVATLYAVMGALFLATMVALAALYSRLALHRVLRVGEA